MKTLVLTYYDDITQGVDESVVHDAVVIFANKLSEWVSKAINEPVEVTVPPVMTVKEQYDDICSNKSHIALMKPVAYVLAHRRFPSILPACVAHRPIDGDVGVFYFAQLYARKDLGITSIDDLIDNSEKYRIAYGDRFSTSNFLIPANLLKKEGIHPFMHFREILFAGGHDLAAEAVYNNEADIGAGHDGAIKIISEKFPDAEDKIIQIARENIHSDPVVVNSLVLPEGINFDLLQQGCTEIAKEPEVAEALDIFWGWVKDLSPTVHENYHSIESAIANMHLTESDILS